MSRQKPILFTILLLLTFTFGIHAQTYTSNNEYIVYTTNPGDIDAIDNLAADFSSTVLDYPSPTSNVALLLWNGMPFHYGNSYVTNMVELLAILQGTSTVDPRPVDIDGGNYNYQIEQESNESTGNPCTINENAKQTHSGSPVTVGIFDTGLNYTLAQQNGYTFQNVVELEGDVIDYNGHGTHVSTIIDEIYHTRITNTPLNYVIGKPFDADGFASFYNLIGMVEELLEGETIDVDIINFSFSYPDTYKGDGDPFYRLLQQKGGDVLFICAAGNDGINIDPSGVSIFTHYFPAAFDLPNILTVGSHGCDLNVPAPSNFSNYGTTSVDFAAHGHDVEGMDHLGNTITMTGTSQATAKVTGTAAALLSRFNNLTPLELKCAIIESGFDAPSFSNHFRYEKALRINKTINNPTLGCESGTGDDGLTNPPQGFNVQSTNNQTLNQNISIYPNPMNDNLNIDFYSEISSDIKIEIFTINGQLVHTVNDKANIGSNNYSVNFNNIAFSNQYILKIISNDSITTRKISRF